MATRSWTRGAKPEGPSMPRMRRLSDSGTGLGVLVAGRGTVVAVGCALLSCSWSGFCFCAGRDGVWDGAASLYCVILFLVFWWKAGRISSKAAQVTLGTTARIYIFTMGWRGATYRRQENPFHFHRKHVRRRRESFSFPLKYLRPRLAAAYKSYISRHLTASLGRISRLLHKQN